MDVTTDKLFDLRGLAEYSSLAVPTLRDYLKGVHPLPHYKVRGKILIRKNEFDEWLAGFRVDGNRLGGIVDDVLRSLKAPRSVRQSEGHTV